MSVRFQPRSDGRWNGQITRSPLPDASDAIAALPSSVRTLLADVWLGQAATEERVGHSFAVVRDALVARGADGGLVATADRAIDDETRHAALCCEMASRYSGRAIEPPAPLTFAHPTHPAARDDAQRNALFVLGQCAFNETFASAYLESALAQAREPIARAAIRELLSDEIDHARIGWAFASTLDARERAGLDEWLVHLAIANLREWRAIQLPREPRDVLAAHGVPDREAVLAALVDAVRTLMIPGFERFGFSVTMLRRWLAAGATT